jgi:hypothetical protein
VYIFSLPTSCVHNYFCERQVVCVTFSIRQVIRITYVENKLWKKKKKKKWTARPVRAVAWRAATWLRVQTDTASFVLAHTARWHNPIDHLFDILSAKSQKRHHPTRPRLLSLLRVPTTPPTPPEISSSPQPVEAWIEEANCGDPLSTSKIPHPNLSCRYLSYGDLLFRSI